MALLTMATYYGLLWLLLWQAISEQISRYYGSTHCGSTYYGYLLWLLLWQAISEQISRYERAVQSAFNDVQRVQRQTQVGDAIVSRGGRRHSK